MEALYSVSDRATMGEAGWVFPSIWLPGGLRSLPSRANATCKGWVIVNSVVGFGVDI